MFDNLEGLEPISRNMHRSTIEGAIMSHSASQKTSLELESKGIDKELKAEMGLGPVDGTKLELWQLEHMPK